MTFLLKPKKVSFLRFTVFLLVYRFFGQYKHLAIMNDLFSANGVTIFRDQNPFKQLRSMSNARVTKKNETDGQNERKTDKITAGQKDK